MADASIELLERQRGKSLEKDANSVCRRSLRALRAYSRVYPFSRGRYYLYLGMYRAAEGRNRAASRQWTRGLHFADLTGFQLDAARIRLYLAQQLPEGSPARSEHLRQSRQALDELGLHRLKAFEKFPV